MAVPKGATCANDNNGLGWDHTQIEPVSNQSLANEMANQKPPDPHEKAPDDAANIDEGLNSNGLGGHVQSEVYKKALRLSSIFDALVTAEQSEALAALIDALDDLTPDCDLEPSLGSLNCFQNYSTLANQTFWADGTGDDREEQDDDEPDSDGEETLDDLPSNIWYDGEFTTMRDVRRLDAIWKNQYLGTPPPPPEGTVLIFGRRVPIIQVDWEYKP
ncbi:MAG TPA: hypothetical protein DIU09_12800 [Hyphomonadaceae bacterium]|nr:hypothetical protein AEM38_08250 [Hyphomonadaceae bacterium UKL13-1]HCP65459.1 hypothetical protein [Hyphomonadaceae bacterium]